MIFFQSNSKKKKKKEKNNTKYSRITKEQLQNNFLYGK